MGVLLFWVLLFFFLRKLALIFSKYRSSVSARLGETNYVFHSPVIGLQKVVNNLQLYQKDIDSFLHQVIVSVV